MTSMTAKLEGLLMKEGIEWSAATNFRRRWSTVVHPAHVLLETTSFPSVHLWLIVELLLLLSYQASLRTCFLSNVDVQPVGLDEVEIKTFFEESLKVLHTISQSRATLTGLEL